MEFDLIREILLLPFLRVFMPHTVALLFASVMFGFARSTLVPLTVLFLLCMCASFLEGISPDAFDTELFVLYLAGILVYCMLTFAVTRVSRNVFELVQRTVRDK